MLSTTIIVNTLHIHVHTARPCRSLAANSQYYCYEIMSIKILTALTVHFDYTMCIEAQRNGFNIYYVLLYGVHVNGIRLDFQEHFSVHSIHLQTNQTKKNRAIIMLKVDHQIH